MDYPHVIASLSPDLYQRLLRALELGKWPDGTALTEPQRANAMQAVIAWGEQHLAVIDRVGYVEKKQKPGELCETPLGDTPQDTPLKWHE